MRSFNRFDRPTRTPHTNRLRLNEEDQLGTVQGKWILVKHALFAH